MAIEFRCIRCGQRLRVPDDDHGKRARCPSCAAVVDIPDRQLPASPLVIAREKSDVIDYELFGDEVQHVEITLDPGEVAVARLESMLYMTPGIALESAVRDEQDSNGGILERLSHVGRRILTGSSLLMTAFCNVAEQREVVAFAPATPGRLIPLHMDELDRLVTCQAAAILCVARGIEMVDAEVPGLPDRMTMQELRGDGIVVLQAAGSIVNHQVKADRQLNIRSSSLIGYTGSVAIAPHENAGIEEQMDITTVTGPGEIWLKLQPD